MGLLHRHSHNDADSSTDDDRDEKKDLHPEQVGATKALRKVVKNSGEPGVATSGAGILGFADHVLKKTEETSWMKRFIPQLENLTAYEEFGNFVISNRKTGEKQWESVPIYVRAGMSLLYTGAGDQVLGYKYIQNQLYKQSVKQGKLFDQEEGAYEHIESFVRTYKLEDTLDQLLEPDLTKYKTFNSFFSRSLKPGARPADPDPQSIVSVADCRLTVWEDVDSAKQFWIKGKQFTIPRLLDDDNMASNPLYKDGCSLAIFRLAPADYHHWHSPLEGVIGSTKAIPGSLYTVNPMAVRNKDVDVFTANKRDIQLLLAPSTQPGQPPVPLPLVSVGAMLVGAIAFLKKQGDTVAKGEDLGYFAYGGSTVIVLFPKGFMKFDDDLLKYSKEGIETVVKVGERIGVRV